MLSHLPDFFLTINNVLFPFFKHPASLFSVTFSNTYQCLLIDDDTEQKLSIVCENIEDDQKVYSILQNDDLNTDCSEFDLVQKYQHFIQQFPNAYFLEQR